MAVSSAPRWCSRRRRAKATSSRPRPGSRPGRPSSSPEDPAPAMAEAAAVPDPGRGAASWGQAGAAVRPLIPAGAYGTVFFAVPMAGLLVLSFWRSQGFELIADFSLESYEKIATSPLYQALALRTVAIGLVTTALVVPMAFALSYVMRFVLERRAQLILQLALVSLFSGYLVRIYAWRTILGKQGLLNSALEWLGIIDEPLQFLIY